MHRPDLPEASKVARPEGCPALLAGPVVRVVPVGRAADLPEA